MTKIKQGIAALLTLVLVFVLLPLPRIAALTPRKDVLSYEAADASFAAIQTALAPLPAEDTASRTAAARKAVQKLGYAVSTQGSERFSWNAQGIPCVFDARLQQLGEAAEPIAGYVDDGQSVTVSYASRKTGPDGENITLIEPYYGLDSNFTQKYQTLCSELAAKTGGTYTLYKGESATIDNVAAALESSAVVVFDSHGTTDYRDGPDLVSQANSSYLCLQTGEGITSKDMEKLTGRFGEYSHAYYATSGSDELNYYCVDGTAIANHLETELPNTLVWMAMCLGMSTDGLCKPLRDAGAGVVYGYSQNISFAGEYSFAECFWEEIGEGADVKTAIATMKQEVGLWDALDNDVTTLQQAKDSLAAFPVVVSEADAYPGQGNVDDLQTVDSDWNLFTAPGDYQLTAVSSNEAHGTVSQTRRIITATPAEGYAVSGCTVTPENACTVLRDGNTFTVRKQQQDCTITVQFTPKQAAVITYAVPEGVSCTVTNSYLGDEPLLPTPTGRPADQTNYYRFLGWSAAAVSDSTQRPTFYAAGKPYPVSVPAQTLYALYVYADASATAADFTAVSALQEDWSGEYVLSYNGQTVLDAGGNYLFTQLGSADASLTLAQAGITAEGETLKKVSGAYAYIIHLEDPVRHAYSIRMKNSSNFLSYPAGNSSATIMTAAEAASDSELWTLAFSGGAFTVTNVAAPDRSLMYNTAGDVFRCYTGGQEPLRLYAGQIGSLHYTTISGVDLCAAGHTYGAWITDIPATCTAVGTQHRVCALCASIETGEIPKLPHTFQKIDEQAATCLAAGWVKLKCSVCGEEKTDTTAAGSNLCPSEKFTDVDTGKWYHAAVDDMLSRKLMSGTSETTFAPDANYSRAMLVMMLYNLEKTPAVTGTNNFPDVRDNFWYTNAITWAAEKNLVSGYSNGKFGPNDDITREQIAAILYRYEAYRLDKEPAVNGTLSGFPDAASVTSYANIAVTWAVGAGLINGMGGKLAPKNSATRAMAAQIFMKFLTQ